MKATKYLVAGVLALSFYAPSMAQDVKSQVEAISKVIIDNNGDVNATKNAVKEFTKVNKKNAQALAGLGRAFLDAKNIEQAKIYADMACKVGKNVADGYLLQGDIAAAQDDGGQAASWYEQATDFDKQNPIGYIKYARVYQKVDPDGAVAMLEKLRQVKPDYPVDAAAGYMYSNNNKLKTAMTWYDKVQDVTKLENYILFDYASTAYVLEQYDKALKLATTGSNTYPQYSAFNRLAFYCYDKQKDYQNAELYANKLFNKTDTTKFIANDYLYYGDVLSNLGRTEEAIAAYKKVKEVDPTRNDVNKLVSEAYEKNKDYANAVASFKQYLADLGDKATANDYRALADIYYSEIEGAEGAKKQAALKAADDVYAEVESKFPYAVDYAVYQRALIHYQMNTDMKTGLAKPYYEKYIELVAGKADKSASELKKLATAYQYLAVHYIQNDKVAEAKANAAKLLEIRPEDETGQQIVNLK